MSTILAIVNQKGGVGKTTTAINLGAYLAELNKRVLLVDIDPQANASSGVGIDTTKLEGTLYDALAGNKDILSVLYPTSIENFHLLPSSADLAGISVEFMNVEGREVLLKNILEPIKDSYDYILIDCPPSVELLTVNALVAANSVLVPVQCEYFSLEGLSRLTSILNIIKKDINPNLEIEGIVLTMFDPRTMLSKEVVKETQKFFGEKVYKTVIPRNVRISEAPSYGQPVSIYAKDSKGAIAYLELAKELVNNVR
jgi:chromosome partitioning protein